MFKTYYLIGFFSIILHSFSYSQCITINQHPQNQLVLDNDDILLTVDATSTESLNYQWQIFNTTTNMWESITDGADYSGTTTNTLNITNVTRAINNARFRVLISGVSVACKETSQEAIITYTFITVNNMFTPNDDGINETFQVNGLSSFPKAKLQIFSRWGNLVYEKINYKNDWNGVATTDFTVNGSKRLPTGTYFYTIILNYDAKKYAGWL